ncbi:glycosyltransferase family 2 protein [Candidatus Microgenomates bacterium]|nr:MAG: glycosyltransferase family 2 protein [Candidatus Microgenomates bacterium]
MKKPKVVIVLPAYNAEQTLQKTIDAIPEDYADEIILVDDVSKDNTVKLAKKIKLKVFVHEKNLGYGGNQKTCYDQALKAGADIVVMVHPDYQYSPELVAPMVEMIKTGLYDCVLGSRILSGDSLRAGMPLYKYIFNRMLTFVENVMTGAKLSEYHTGLRAYSKKVLTTIPYKKNSDDFIFDNQVLVQIMAHKFRIGELSCPTKYFAEASSINFSRSMTYGFGCLYWGFMFFLGRIKIYRHPIIFTNK